jgi:L-iditol 2-dehydrogenase
MWLGSNNEGKFPFIPGHEWMGEVIEVGASVDTLKPGDRVVGECFLTCHDCPECKDGMDPVMCRNTRIYGFTWDTPGGFAEYHVTKPERLHKVPDNISDTDAACIEAISVAYHGIWGGGGCVAPFDDVVVFGAGPIGLYGILGCKGSGAFVIAVEPEPYRRKLAAAVGADVVLDPTDGHVVDAIRDLTEGRGVSFVLECSGSDRALADTINVVRKHGRISLVGQSVGRKVPIEIGLSIWKGTTIFGACDSPYFFPKTLKFMSRTADKLPFSKVVTHTFSLDQIDQAFELGKKPPFEYGKIVLTI